MYILAFMIMCVKFGSVCVCVPVCVIFSFIWSKELSGILALF